MVIQHLEIALKSFNFKIGSEVITTQFTFLSKAEAIVNQGLMPIFCNIGHDYPEP